MLAPAPLFAEELGARLVVDFSAERAEDTWVAHAFEQNAARDLAGHRGTLIDKSEIDTRGCERGNADCLVDRYAKDKIDLIILGRLKERTLELHVYEGWLKTRIAHEVINLEARPTLIEVHNRTLASVAPFFQSGGLLEKKQWILSAPDAQDRDLPFDLVLAVLIASALFLAMPIAFGLIIGAPISRRALLWSLRLAAAPPLALIASTMIRGIDGLEWMMPMIGGAVWSWFLLITLRVGVPALTGLSSIRHGNVGRMLRAWCIASAMRIALLILFIGPFLIGVVYAASRRGVPDRTTWIVMVPLFGLLCHFWLASLVEHVTLHLDRVLVVGKATPDNGWHPVVKKYFMGYLRRAGLELERSMLDRILFLPGTQSEIFTYGGGLSRARIAVPEALLETALHQLDDEQVIVDEDASSLDLADPSGYLLPGGSASRKKKEEAPPARRKRFWPLLGQNETLLGYVNPLPKGESVPLVIDDPDEYAVLRELLTAHYSAFDPKRYGEEADDTDPTQKDFLFGALLREVGCVQRKDTLLTSLLLSLDLVIATGPKWIGALERLAIAFYRRFFARYPAVVADGYAALNRGLHHLIQHLDYLRTRSDAGLTARADEPTLHSTSSEILRRIAAETGSVEDHTRNRLVWLSTHLFAEIPEKRLVSLRMLFGTALVLATAGWIAKLVLESIEYQPIYQKRIQEQQQKILAREKEDSDDGQ